MFQFTRPRGARLPTVPTKVSELEFQFTRPRGARRLAIAIAFVGIAFQFTRPRGARRTSASWKPATRCFNSRAREGRD